MYKFNRSWWVEYEIMCAARDLGDDGMTFAEAGYILGMPRPTRLGEATREAFPFDPHPKSSLYRAWLKQPIALIEDVREAYDNGHV